MRTVPQYHKDAMAQQLDIGLVEEIESEDVPVFLC